VGSTAATLKSKGGAAVYAVAEEEGQPVINSRTVQERFRPACPAKREGKEKTGEESGAEPSRKKREPAAFYW